MKLARHRFVCWVMEENCPKMRAVSGPVDWVTACAISRSFFNKGRSIHITVHGAKAAAQLESVIWGLKQNQLICMDKPFYGTPAPYTIKDDYPRCYFSIAWWFRKVTSFFVFWIGGPLGTKEYFKWHGWPK